MRSLPNSNVVRACVIADDVSTPYIRVGRGEPVVLLADDRCFATGLLAALPPHVSVVAPEAFPSKEADLLPWLWTFLDALGLERAVFVLTPRFGDSANTLRKELERVVGVLLVDGVADGEGIATAVHQTLDFVTAQGMPDR